MFNEVPRGLKHATEIDKRLRMLEAVDSARPLREWTAELVSRRGAVKPDFLVPHFDPADAGAGARVLFLL